MALNKFYKKKSKKNQKKFGKSKKIIDLCHNLNNLIYFTNTMEKTLSFDVAEMTENELLTDFSLGTNYPTIKASERRRRRTR
ncbi:MAG: hypothetical protein EAY69_09795 [Cytophagales bacterium]|nr:MAG: hypothetical protein EAY69_09795 [Cytophagales bacterium]